MSYVEKEIVSNPIQDIIALLADQNPPNIENYETMREIRHGDVEKRFDQ